MTTIFSRVGQLFVMILLGLMFILSVPIHAQLPSRPDIPTNFSPTYQQRLQATSGLTSLFGWSVTLSGDGNTALIGAWRENSDTGAAYVFTRNGNMWSQSQKLTGLTMTGSDFGYSVALNTNGNTALIGAWGENSNTSVAYVFSFDGTAWSQTQVLTVANTTGNQFGYNVALSGDGNTALIGAPAETNDTGAAYMFIHNGSTWSQPQRLTGSTMPGSSFGSKVALSSNGSTALIGAMSENNQIGAAYVFNFNGSTWSQPQKLTGSTIQNSRFGYSVALNSDGMTALIGAAGENSFTGAAYVLTRSGNAWSQPQRLTGSTSEFSYFGSSVAVSSDSNTLLIGAENDTYGSAYVFTRSGSTWNQPQHLILSTTSTTHFGFSVAISNDGKTALIGAPNENPGGIAYIFGLYHSYISLLMK